MVLLKERRTAPSGLTPLLSWEAAFSRLFSSPYYCTWQAHFLLDRRNYLKVENVYGHRFGFYQHSDNEMFSLVTQKVMAQPLSEKSSTECATSSGLARLEKVMVRVV